MKFRSSTRPMVARMAVGAVALLSYLTVENSAQAAPNANDIMRRSAAATNSIRSYKATYRTTTAFGGNTIHATQEIVMLPASGKVRMTMTQNTGGRSNKSLMVDDGRHMYSYTIGEKTFMKFPHRMNMAQMQLNPTAAFGGTGASYKWLRSARVGARPVHVIQIVPSQKMRPPNSSSTILAYVDQSTYRLRQMEVKSSVKGRGNATNTMNMKMVVVNEAINVPIPASAFRFVPPRGVTELKMSTRPGRQ